MGLFGRVVAKGLVSNTFKWIVKILYELEIYNIIIFYANRLLIFPFAFFEEIIQINTWYIHLAANKFHRYFPISFLLRYDRPIPQILS